MAKEEGISRGTKIVELIESSIDGNFQNSKRKQEELEAKFQRLEQEFALQKYINNQQNKSLDDLKELINRKIARGLNESALDVSFN